MSLPDESDYESFYHARSQGFPDRKAKIVL
jgi:hypothetical protein